MELLLTGATGYLGGVVARRLAEAGHALTAVVREPSRATGLPAGTRLVQGAVESPEVLADAASRVDGVVHLAPSGGLATDLAAARAFTDALAGRGGVLVWTTGVWVLGPTDGGAAAEDSPTAPIALVHDRVAAERAVLSAADVVRAVVLRPGIVHGHGGGIPALLVEQARRAGTGVVTGAADVRWPMVHVDDLADLYVAAVERAASGSVLHGVAEEGVPVTDLATAAAHAAGAGPGWTVRSTAETATEVGAAFADALATSQVVSATRTRFALGWHPRRVGAVTDVAAGSYARPSAA
ncbi:NAD-dependent epimerase/dehydratase family protein [Actinotalea fermentans]|uniref:NAD-dependent epimerase/dehydratase domain-containing protein n=1 Tax=Actinotalea fermentans TaxID=43671 RepID=A0A511YW26_9CELL|nr:NAD-dependent epimerase/dehydratase family protein [Actinotalea fermentans]KGM17396.1 hypothetical protein N867_03925 [Actinotalea fermentans ATCC 43279 = JCM 9966 = DSM 3133]GEN79393.1 hypothetical protein AFE02nite_11270 [Actinotalea fermentans]